MNIWADPDDRRRLVDELMRTGVVENLEARFIRKDGTVAELEVSLKAVSLGGEQFLLGAGRDMSEIKHAQEKAAESEERLKAFIENAPDAFFVHDMAGCILQVNEQACQSLGYDRSELIGMSVRLCPLFSPAVMP